MSEERKPKTDKVEKRKPRLIDRLSRWPRIDVVHPSPAQKARYTRLVRTNPPEQDNNGSV